MEESELIRTLTISVIANAVEAIPATKRAPYTPKEQRLYQCEDHGV